MEATPLLLTPNVLDIIIFHLLIYSISLTFIVIATVPFRVTEPSANHKPNAHIKSLDTLILLINSKEV